MWKKANLTRLLMRFALLVVLTGCGAPATPSPQADPDEVATLLTPTMQAQPPTTTDAPQPPETNPTPTEAPLDYTEGSNNNQCQRRVIMLGGSGGGGGQAMFPNIDQDSAVELQLTFEGEQVHKAVFSADGSQLLALGSQKARLWNTLTGAPPAKIELDENDGSISDAAFSPDGRKIYIGTSQGQVWVREPESDRLRLLAALPGYDIKLDIHPDGEWVAAAYNPNKINSTEKNFWDNPDNPSQIRLLDAEGKTLRRFEGEVLEIHEEYGQFMATFAKGHFFPVNSVRFSPNGQALLTAGDDAAIRLWDVETGEHLGCLELLDDKEIMRDSQAGDNPREVYKAAFSPDGRKVLGLHFNIDVIVWDLLSGAILQKISYPDDIFGYYTHKSIGRFKTATFSPDGESILTTGAENQVRAWDAESGELVMALWTPARAYWAGYHPSGELVATAFKDSNDPSSTSLWFWDIDHPSLNKTLETTKHLSDAYRDFLEGRIDVALVVIDEIAVTQSSSAAGILYTEACRYAAVWYWPSQALPSCEKAVGLADSLGDATLKFRAHESYAIALARSGDFAKAANELEDSRDLALDMGEGFFVSDNDRESFLTSREEWLVKLQNDEDPFTEEELIEFQSEFQNPGIG